MKIELKHLSAYPCGLKLLHDISAWHPSQHEKGKPMERIVIYSGFRHSQFPSIHYDFLEEDNKGGGNDYIERFKPILRPLSDLTKEIEHNGEKFLGSDEFTDNEWDEFLSLEYFPEMFDKKGLTSILDYDSVLELIKRHFDVFGLIPQGLAIDYNTINNN